MKKLVVLVWALGMVTVYAQSPAGEKSLQTTGTQRETPPSAFSITAKANEIVKGNVTYGGIAVQLVKTRKPLQLFNPAAPARYGSAEDNLVRDPTNGHTLGLKLFSIRF